MIHKHIEKVEQADLQALVTNQVKEGRTIEYKESLPGGNDKDRKEFLADVSSFANAAGGDMLFGVMEQRDADGKTTGIPDSVPGLAGINVDQEIRRLDSMVQDGIGPRVPGLRVWPIDGFPAGPVLLMRIPRSYAAPHMVTFQGSGRFYSRNNAGKYPLDVTEIRSAFAASEDLPERIRRFRHERIARIVAGETPIALPEGPLLVLHIAPLAAFSTRVTVDMAALNVQGGLSLLGMSGLGHHRRLNYDGVLSYRVVSQQGEGTAYTQVFRNGTAELVDAMTLRKRNSSVLLPAQLVEKAFLAAVTEYVPKFIDLGLPPPFVVLPSVLGVKGWEIISGGDSEDHIDRPDLLLPDVIVEEASQDPAAVLRPAFDALWQSSGWLRSMTYNKSGVWQPR